MPRAFETGGGRETESYDSRGPAAGRPTVSALEGPIEVTGEYRRDAAEREV